MTVQELIDFLQLQNANLEVVIGDGLKTIPADDGTQDSHYSIRDSSLKKVKDGKEVLPSDPDYGSSDSVVCLRASSILAKKGV